MGGKMRIHLCRKCKAELIVGKNIAEKTLLHREYICTPCNTVFKKQWAIKNPEKTREKAKYRMRAWKARQRLLRGFDRAVGVNHANWKCGKILTGKGYIGIRNPSHPRAGVNGYVAEHIYIAEKALGKSLPIKAQVHHMDGDKSNNNNSNLVICENQKYHSLLHQRMRALKACGNVKYRKCPICETYDSVDNMYIYPKGNGAYHNECLQKRRHL